MKIYRIILVCAILAFVAGPSFTGENTRMKAPRVVYSAPDNDSVIDLTGKESLEFVWKGMPLPAGGRKAYKITVYKGFSYDIVFAQELARDVFSVEVPAEKFEDGLTYSWTVKQRDASSNRWSRYDTWSFKVVKK